MNDTKRVIALGFFDGVHTGHGALLSRVREKAAALEAVPTAFTFDAHPGSRITGAVTPLINSAADRADLMRRLYGIREIIVAHFDSMMRMPWEDFITEYLVKEQGAVHVVAGHDFHFGYKGEGNPRRLAEKCAALGVGCDIIPKIEKEGITISSTYIRTLIAQGEMGRRIFGPPPRAYRPGGPRQEAGLHPGLPHGESPLSPRRAGAGLRGVRHPGVV